MESYDYPADCGSLGVAQTVVSTSHGFLQTDAELVMVKLQTTAEGSALS